MHTLQSAKTGADIARTVSNYPKESQELESCLIRAASEFFQGSFQKDSPFLFYQYRKKLEGGSIDTELRFKTCTDKSELDTSIFPPRELHALNPPWKSHSFIILTLNFLQDVSNVVLHTVRKYPAEAGLKSSLETRGLDDAVSTEELVEALKDLREATDEACEEGFPNPSDTAKANAEQLIKKMHEISPRRFEVYPTPDGEIAIDAPSGKGKSVVVFCDSEGGVLCMVNINGEHRRAQYSNANKLPDSFVRDALAELEQ